MATEGGDATYPTAEPRGVGGKLKRQTARRHASTPYSRPPQNQAQRRPWISRIVDPAYRIISGGATRILPYFFSNASSANAITAPEDQEQHHQDEVQDDSEEDDLQENGPSITQSLYKPDSASFEVGGTSGTANENEGNFNVSAQKKDKRALSDALAISELEKVMEGKSFSRAETDRLIEILNSRAIDLPDSTRDERTEMSLREKATKNTSFLDMKKEPIGGKGDSEFWATPKPLAKSIISDGGKQIQDEAGLSPAELAKAYMGGQTSSSTSHGFVARNEKKCLDGGTPVAKSSVASPSSKPSACWPGVKLNEEYGFATPQSRRENFGLQNFPRTPYSRAILSSSKSQLLNLQDNSSKRLSIFQSPSQSVQTRSGQLKLSNRRDGEIFGPNRRSRQSATMSPYSRPSSGTSRFEKSAIMKSSEERESSNLFRSQATTYDKHKGSEVGTPTVPTHSSQTARTILEHLRTHQPFPKDKSAELKLTTSWGSPESSNIKHVEKDASTKLNEDTRNIFSHNPPSSVPKFSDTTSGDTQNAMAKIDLASNGVFNGAHAASSSGTTPQTELEKPKGSLIESTHGKDAGKAVSYSFGGEPANIPKPPSHGNNKRVLPSIAVAKPSQRWAVPSGSNASFTFPVSSSDGATSSEPTTPSIMPFTTSPLLPSAGIAITSRHEATKDEEVPQFSFNGNRGGDESRLVFDFPSANEEVMEEDNARLGISFTFGSENSERISFSSSGSDGVCC